MFSRPQLRLISVIALLFTLAHATWFDAHILRRESEKQIRADPLSGVNSAVSGLLGGLVGSASSSTPVSSASQKPSSVSSGGSTTSSKPPSSSASSSAPATSSTPQSATSTPASSTSSSSGPSPTSSTPQSTPTPSVDQVTVVQTVSGSTYTSVSSSTESSATSKATNQASLNGGSNVQSGMSPKTKNTVIGVVVGVGGAIILAGLFIVAWRIWGRKKNEDEGDGLMGFRSGSAGQEKSGSVSAAGPANPFQSTLENYHNPARNVNASSNF